MIDEVVDGGHDRANKQSECAAHNLYIFNGMGFVFTIYFLHIFNGMGFVYNFLLFIFKCLLRSRSCLVCRSREDSKEEH